MTKKLLLPTRRKRMEIRQQQVELPGRGRSALSSSPPSVLSHNKQCEEEENASRLQRWVQDQQLQQQQENEAEDPVCSRSSSPSPPALPPRPLREETNTDLAATAEVHYPQLEAIEYLDQPPTYESCLEPQSPALSTLSDAPLLPDNISNEYVDAHFHAKDNENALCLQSDPIQQPDLNSPANIDAQVFRTISQEPISESIPEPEALQVSSRQSQHKRSPPPVPPKPNFALSLSLQPLPSPPIAIADLPQPPSTTCDLPAPHDPSSPITPPHMHFSQPRVFTSHDSRFKVSARLLSWHAGKVHLLKSNGVRIAVPLHRFSGVDVEYVLREMMGRAELEANRKMEDTGVVEVEGQCGGVDRGGMEDGWRGELERVYASA